MVQSQPRQNGFTIARLASAVGVGVETVRYYQRRALMLEPPKAGTTRRYGPDDVRRLHFIRQAKAAGFTLQEIKELLALDATGDRVKVRGLARDRVKALDMQIKSLKQSRDALRKLATACARSDQGPCPILSAFEE